MEFQSIIYTKILIFWYSLTTNSNLQELLNRKRVSYKNNLIKTQCLPSQIKETFCGEEDNDVNDF